MNQWSYMKRDARLVTPQLPALCRRLPLRVHGARGAARCAMRAVCVQRMRACGTARVSAPRAARRYGVLLRQMFCALELRTLHAIRYRRRRRSAARFSERVRYEWRLR